MTWILLTSAWKRNHLNSTSQHHRNNELFYHPHVFSVQTFEQSKQVKLSCIAPVESGHCIAVKWCMPWKTLQNLMTWWTWSTEICASLMPPNHSHALNHKLHLKNLDDSFDRESATHLPYELVQKIHRQQSNAKKILLHLSASFWTNATQMNWHSSALKTRQLT